MAIALRYAARSDVGLLRDHNEDSGYVGPRLLMVADGVGGHAAGEVASSLAVAVMANLDEDSPGGDLLDQLSGAIHTANTYLRDMIHGDSELQGMSTTLTALLRAGSRFGLAHVGDSRCYLLRNGELQQITHDHTFVQTLVDEGRISAEEADHHPQRNVITNALDGREDLELDLSVREARLGDRYLLCSDGLSGVVSQETLRESLSTNDRPEHAVEQLVELALRGGGPDNITAIVADVVDVDVVPSSVPLVVGAAEQDGVRRPGGNSPAARAAALAPPREEPGSYDDEDEVPSHRVRRILLALLVLAVLAGGGYGAWRWSQDQYYVGSSEGHVAIYRGLTQDIGPLRTSKVFAEQDIALTDLPAYQRQRVESDIAAADLEDAHRIVQQLARQAEICRAAATHGGSSPAPTASAGPSTAPSTSPSTPAPDPGAGDCT